MFDAGIKVCCVHCRLEQCGNWKSTDLSTAEKELMLSWNLYLHDHPCLSDEHVSQRCIDFAAAQAKELQASSDLRRCFMVHLINLWEFDIVSSDLVDACMASIDSIV